MLSLEEEKEDENHADANTSVADKQNTNNCIPAAVTQFPGPGMGQGARQHGGIIIHITVAIYMFIGLAIVCDDYFVPSLTRVSDGKWVGLGWIDGD